MQKFICRCVIAWIFPIAYFWLFKSDAMFYSIVFLHGWYNVFAVVTAFLIGKRNYFGIFKWIAPLVIGVMNVMTYPVTFGLLHDINYGKFEFFDIDIRTLIHHVVLSFVGLVAGVIIGFIVNRAKEQESKSVLFNIPGWMWGVFIAWIFPIIKFWVFDFDTIFFSVFLYIWYMLLAFLASALIGRRGSPGVHKWLQAVILLLMNMVVYPLTVGLVEMQKGSMKDLIDIKYIVAQVIIVAVGFLMGMSVCYICNRKAIKE